jgi:hypothetical protein
MPTPEEKIGRQLRSVCIHEISHAFAAMQRCAKIGFALARTAQGEWTAQAICDIADNDKNLDSVYGWAGVVGEAIEANREHAVLLALDRYRNQRCSISDTDLDSIECVTPDCRTKTAEMAFQTLVGSWNEIKALQNKVLTLIETEKQPGVVFIWTKEDGWKQH